MALIPQEVHPLLEMTVPVPSVITTLGSGRGC
jgi:hypothetical protein